jgi:hypothetical protein
MADVSKSATGTIRHHPAPSGTIRHHPAVNGTKKNQKLVGTIVPRRPGVTMSHIFEFLA